MVGQVKFFRKNLIDLDKPNVLITITDTVAVSNGQDSVSLLRDRSNGTAWRTTLSDDTADTVILADLGDYFDIDTVGIVKHNFKTILIQWFNSVSGLFENFGLGNYILNESGTIYFNDTVNTNKIKITIFDTQVVDADKELRQLILTKSLIGGQLEGWPQIKKPKHSKSRQVNKMLSGKVNVIESVGAYSCELEVKSWGSDNDLSIVENIYDRREGVLMLLSGQNESQFRTLRQGYRDEDIILVRPVNEYENPHTLGIYKNGIKIKMKLVEAIS